MHELSIAGAIFDQVQRHAPPGSVVRSVELYAGPMRGIEATAMEWAWKSVTAGTPFEQAKLNLTLLPWTLRCPACSREFTSDDLYTPCACGSAEAHPQGGDELKIVSLMVDDEP